MAYRITRNLEASIIDFINSYLTGSAPDWTDVDVINTFSQIKKEKLTPPIICLRCGVADHAKIQIGDDSTLRTSQILIDIFASDDGQRLDLKDWLITILKHGCPYYEYVIVNGSVQSKTENGRIRVLTIADTPLEFDTDKNRLSPIDRYRHLLTLEVSTGKVEV